MPYTILSFEKYRISFAKKDAFALGNGRQFAKKDDAQKKTNRREVQILRIDRFVHVLLALPFTTAW